MDVKKIFIGMGLLVMANTVMADADAERDALSRLAFEISQLELLIKQAESQAQSSDRIVFDYNALRNDLAMIRGAIKTHIQSPRTTPRVLPPLQGDYRR